MCCCRFYIAYSQAMLQPELEQKAFDIFRHYPAPAENSLEKHMRKQLGIPPSTAATAQKRQGLLHIYKTLCTQGKCNICPLYRDKEKELHRRFKTAPTEHKMLIISGVI